VILACVNSLDGHCVPVEEIKNKFKLENLHRRWHILPCSGITGFNIDEGMNFCFAICFLFLVICLLAQL
jgi:hypothetical protein